MADREERWEVAELVAALDRTIAPRLLATHPATGWCWSCRGDAPCSMRTLAEAAEACASPRAGRAAPATPPTSLVRLSSDQPGSPPTSQDRVRKM